MCNDFLRQCYWKSPGTSFDAGLSLRARAPEFVSGRQESILCGPRHSQTFPDAPGVQNIEIYLEFIVEYSQKSPGTSFEAGFEAGWDIPQCLSRLDLVSGYSESILGVPRRSQKLPEAARNSKI